MFTNLPRRRHFLSNTKPLLAARLTSKRVVRTTGLRGVPLWSAWLATVLLVLSVGYVGQARGEESIQAPHLYWRNGDVLPGVLTNACEDEIGWSTDVFSDPLRLRLNSVHMIRFPIVSAHYDKSGDTQGAPTIETRDGNRFYGTIVETTDQTIVVDTFQHGELRIRRDAIGLIANRTSRAHVYSGPKGLRGWNTVTYGRRLSEWEELPGGRLTTKLVAAELHRSLPANGSVDIDVEFLWRSNPSFQIRFLTPFAEPTKETVKLETRANNYVIQTLGSNGRFRQLDSIPKDQTKCRFLLRWSQTANQLSVYRGRKYLGKMSVKRSDAKTGPAGIYIKNTGPQLTLSRLEIRAGSTLDMTETNGQADTILRADNESISGTIAAISHDTVELLDEHETVTRLLWSDISEVRFRTAETDVMPTSEGAECVFQNGETLRGRLVTADRQSVTIRVPAIANVVKCTFRDLERIVVHPKSVPPPRGTPTITVGQHVLHGHLRATRSGRLGWLPLDGIEPTPLADDRPIRIELEAIETQNAGSADDDLLYLRSGDVIPCRIRSSNAQGLNVSSRFAHDALLPHEEVKAVELAGRPTPPIEDFDEKWVVEDARRAVFDESRSHVTFLQPTTAKHPTLLTGCDQLEFTLHRKQFEKLGSFFQVTLHGEDENVRTVPFYFSGKKSFVMGTLGAAFKPIPQDKGEFAVRIQTHPFEILVNEVSMGVSRKTLREDRNTKWLGVSFTLGQGQAPGIGGVRRFARGQTVLSVKNLRVSRVRRPAISHTTVAVDTTALLTVPRNADSDELTHLAVGTNNDVVRGKLIRLDEENVTMRSKQATRMLPRHALSGLIWLSNAELPDGEAHSVAQVVLRDTTTVGLTSPRINANHLEGDHPLLGPFKIARSDIQTVLLGSAPNRYHKHAFLSWSARNAPQPNFDQQRDLASRLIGERPNVELEFVNSSNGFQVADYRGRVVVLEFWATWCAPCIKNMPRVLETVAQFSPDEVSLVAINQGEQRHLVETMLTAKGWDMPTALDPDHVTSRIFNVGNLPQTVVLDRSGVVAAVFAGAEPDLPTELKSAIDRLLRDEP